MEENQGEPLNQVMSASEGDSGLGWHGAPVACGEGAVIEVGALGSQTGVQGGGDSLRCAGRAQPLRAPGLAGSQRKWKGKLLPVVGLVCEAKVSGL